MPNPPVKRKPPVRVCKPRPSTNNPVGIGNHEVAALTTPTVLKIEW
jgi:hypothetical protein